jgi:hypothetical protein
MATRSANSTSSALLLILLIFTFPLWFGLGAALFGVIIGLCAAAFGVVVAIFAAAVAIVTLPFKLLFGWSDGGWDDWGWHFHIGPHINGFMIIAIVIVIALVIRSRDHKRA